MRLHGFECHITVDMADARIAAEVAEQLGWSTSEIARDPVLGYATYYYLTIHGHAYLTVYNQMVEAVALLRKREAKVVREKIEEVIHDVRYGT